jgi:hypothetical protein
MQGAWTGIFQGYRGEAMQNLGYELPRISIPRRWVNKPPTGVPDPLGWHHAHVADLLEKRELARRRNLYVGRGEQGLDPPSLRGAR